MFSRPKSTSPKLASPKSTSPRPAFDQSKLANYEGIYEWVTSDACITVNDIRKKYIHKLELDRASRIFDVCKAPKSIFAKMRPDLDGRQIHILAIEHAKVPFVSADQATEFLASLADNPSIFRWVVSDECKTIEDIKEKFDIEDEFIRAKRIFDVCKNEDPLDSIFAQARIDLKWSPRQLSILAMVHVDTPFTSVNQAIQYLPEAKNRKSILHGPGSGSLEDLKIGRNIDTIYRFVISEKCQSLDDIKKEFDLPGEIAAGEKIYLVCKSNEPSMFTDLRKGWSMKELVSVAKAHAETSFKDANEVNQFLRIQRRAKNTPRLSALAEFAPSPSSP